jgi:hypothetical protein
VSSGCLEGSWMEEEGMRRKDERRDGKGDMGRG